jgi:hypothetical protein
MHINHILQGHKAVKEAVQENQEADGGRSWMIVKAGCRYAPISNFQTGTIKKQARAKHGPSKSIDEKVERDRIIKQAKEVLEIEFSNLPLQEISACIDEQCLKVFLLQTPAKDFQTTSVNL